MIRRLLALALLVPSLASASYFSEVLADSPTTYWHMDTTSGTETNAGSTSGSCNGTYQNSPTRGASGIPGTAGDAAVTFATASGQYMDTTTAAPGCNSTIGNPGAGDLTVEAWVKPASSVGSAVVAAKTDATTIVWWLLINSNVTRFDIWQPGCCTVYSTSGLATTTFTNGTWYYIVGRYTASTTKTEIIVNTVSENSSTSVTGSINTAGQIRLGKDETGFRSGLDGTLDEVAVYNSALSNARITAHYNAGNTAPASGAGFPFSVKRDTLKPSRFGFSRPILNVNAPGFIVDRMNKPWLSRSQYRPMGEFLRTGTDG